MNKFNSRLLTFCLMSNHFHLLVRVPRRPEVGDLPLEVIFARMERAVGEKKCLGGWLVREEP
jgi:REP element-mobilizing transposase RayT